jgi:hypothetical protein
LLGAQELVRLEEVLTDLDKVLLRKGVVSLVFRADFCAYFAIEDLILHLKKNLFELLNFSDGACFVQIIQESSRIERIRVVRIQGAVLKQLRQP